MIDVPFTEIAGDLDEESLLRIKSELGPGERLLWAVRPRSQPSAISWGFPIAGFLAGLFFLLGFVFMRLSFQAGLAPNEKPWVLVVVCYALTFFIVVGMVLSRREKHVRALRVDNTLYALTDRRAMAWLPHVKKGAMEIISIHRGEGLRLSRVEYPDGTGDVLFRSRVKGEFEDFDRNEFAGFEGIQDVRQVEEQVRRILLPEIGAKLSD